MTVVQSPLKVRARSGGTAGLNQLLKQRLGEVGKCCRGLAGDPKSVHKLRVSTRRAAAALKLAKDALPARKLSQAADLLHSLRRRAGAVRDLDIFLETIHSASAPSTRAFLAGHAAHNRLRNYTNLEATVAKLKTDVAALARLRVGDAKTHHDAFETLIAKHARRQLERFNESLAAALGKNNSEHLHQLRIRGKRLRYTLELAETEFSPLIRPIEVLQEILGGWNDAIAVQPLLEQAKAAAMSVNGAAGSVVIQGIAALHRQAKRAEVKQLSSFGRWAKAWQKPS